MHALIIEDQFLIALSVEEALRELRYLTFDIAPSVALAVMAATKHCPDLIVADHRILDGTGTDAVLAICSDKPIPTVFLTGSGEEVRERLPGALILPKPYTMAQLKDAIDAAVVRPFLSGTD